MLQTDLSFDYLFRENRSERARLLLLLHGYGSDEADLFSFGAQLPGRYFVVSLRAPHPLSFGGYAWYSLTAAANGELISDDAQAMACYEALPAFIDALRDKHHLASEAVTAVGFSQGAAISYGLALNHPEKMGKIAGMSGYINPAYLPKSAEDYSGLDIFMSHGTADAVVPFDWGLKACDTLQELGVKHEFKRYENLGHSINPSVFQDLLRFLDRD